MLVASFRVAERPFPSQGRRRGRFGIINAKRLRGIAALT
jgi:hypothetical protein